MLDSGAVVPRLYDYFNLGKQQPELDFVDVPVSAGIPLRLLPSSLQAEVEDPWLARNLWWPHRVRPRVESRCCDWGDLLRCRGEYAARESWSATNAATDTEQEWVRGAPGRSTSRWMRCLGRAEQ